MDLTLALVDLVLRLGPGLLGLLGVVGSLLADVAHHVGKVAHVVVAGVVAAVRPDLVHNLVHAAHERAHEGAARLLVGLRSRVLRRSRLDLGDHEGAAVGLLQHLEVDAIETLDECVSDLDDLEVDSDELVLAVQAHGHGGVDAEAEAQILGVDGQVLSLVVVGIRLDHRSEGHGAKRIRLGVDLEAVEQQTIARAGMVDGELQLEVARVTGTSAVESRITGHDDRTSWAVELDGLVLSIGANGERESLEGGFSGAEVVGSRWEKNGFRSRR